jgi:hypothetical protein
MVFVPALTMSVWWMAERGQRAYGLSVAAMQAGLTGSLLSKVAAAAVLVPLGSTGITSQIGSLSYLARLAALGVAGIFGIYSVVMLIHVAPAFAAIADIGPESFRTPRWYFVSRDAGALLMVGLAWLVAEKPVALALSFGLVTFFAFSFLFQVNYVCVCLVLGLILFSDRSRAHPEGRFGFHRSGRCNTGSPRWLKHLRICGTTANISVVLLHQFRVEARQTET